MDINFKYRDRSSPKSGYLTYQHFITLKVETGPDKAYDRLVAWVVIQRLTKPLISWLNEHKINHVQSFEGLDTCVFRFTSKADAMLFRLNNV